MPSNSVCLTGIEVFENMAGETVFTQSFPAAFDGVEFRPGGTSGACSGDDQLAGEMPAGLDPWP